MLNLVLIFIYNLILASGSDTCCSYLVVANQEHSSPIEICPQVWLSSNSFQAIFVRAFCMQALYKQK